jgi:hypothetical protein
MPCKTCSYRRIVNYHKLYGWVPIGKKCRHHTAQMPQKRLWPEDPCGLSADLVFPYGSF